MTPHESETLLREALMARVGDVDTTADPWLRVSRAHRRSQARRRVATVSGLAAAAVAVAVTLIGSPPWANRAEPAPAQQPSVVIVDQPDFGIEPWGPGSDGIRGYLRLADGKPRGALGRDPDLRADVVAAVRNPGDNGIPGWKLTDPSRLQVLWADVRDGRRLALAMAVLETEPPASTTEPTVEPLIWVGEPTAGAPMRIMEEYNVASGVVAKIYRGDDGQARVLAIVRRGATVVGSRPTITADGRIQQHAWQSLPVQDGVVDVPLPDPAGRGPLTLRATVGTGGGAYVSTRGTAPLSNDDFGLAMAGTTEAEVVAASRRARGPGVGSDWTIAALNTVIARFGTDFAHTAPRIEWAGPGAAGESVTAVSAGLSGQGRLLQISMRTNRLERWFFERPLPASDRPFSLGWRVPAVDATGKAAGQVAGWLLGPDVTSVTVTVDGVSRPGPLRDGLGWVSVQPKQKVIVTGHRATGDFQLPLPLQERRESDSRRGDPLGVG
jgi:hypothetical protein